MKKLILVFMIVMFLGIVSAAEFDNRLTYSNNDMRAVIDNAFGLPFFGSRLGTAELKSHKSVDQVIQIFPSKNSPVIIYDMNFIPGNSLGEVEWTNIKTGETEERDYYYAQAIYEDKLKPVNEFVCNTITENETSWQECGNVKIGENIEKEFVRWERITDGNIPTGKTEVAVITDTRDGEVYDTIVTFAGRKLSKHAVWNSTFEIGLVAYYDFDEVNGTTTLVEFFGNTTEDGEHFGVGENTNWVTGIIGNAFDFPTNVTGNFFNMTYDLPADSLTINFWVKPNGLTDGNSFFGVDDAGIRDGDFIFTQESGVMRWRIDSGGVRVELDADSGLQDDVFTMITITTNGTNYWMYLNGTVQSNVILADQSPLTNVVGCWGLGNAVAITCPSSIASVNNITLDEFSIYNINLTQAEVTALYDNGTGISPGEATLGSPTVTLNNPPERFNTTNQTVDFNGTITAPIGIDNVTLFIDGILNETNSSGINATDYLFTVTLDAGVHNWTYESCNSISCTTATTRNFTIFAFLTNNYTFNSSSFETGQERFTVNITTNGSTPTDAELIFNGTTFTGATVTSLGGNDFNLSRSIAIPIGVGTANFHFNFSLGEEFNTTTQDQIINLTNLSICGDVTNGIPFINITFRNETLAEEPVTATISSTFVFSLSALSGVNKTLSFTDATENLNYTFCGTPNRTLNVDIDIDYDNSISQQRSFSSIRTISNITATEILYLLPTTLGLFSPFKTTNINGDTIDFVSATITRVLNSVIITVASGLTDSSGFATFFLDPNVAHTATFSKSGFDNNVFIFIPSTDLRTVVMGGGGVISNGTIISRGTSYTISPRNTTLPNNTVVSFTFNVTSNLTSITLISMNITNSTNEQLLFVSNAGVGNLSGTLDTSNNTKLVGIFLIQTADETITVTRNWLIFTTFAGDYSIFTQFTLAQDNDLISEFIRLLIILAFMAGVLIFMNVGKVIETSESNIAVLLLMTWAFSLVGWLDTGLLVSTSDSGINRLGEFSNQFGIAILLTIPGLFFILRRLFIRVPR